MVEENQPVVLDAAADDVIAASSIRSSRSFAAALNTGTGQADSPPTVNTTAFIPRSGSKCSLHLDLAGYNMDLNKVRAMIIAALRPLGATGSDLRTAKKACIVAFKTIKEMENVRAQGLSLGGRRIPMSKCVSHSANVIVVRLDRLGMDEPEVMKDEILQFVDSCKEITAKVVDFRVIEVGGLTTPQANIIFDVANDPAQIKKWPRVWEYEENRAIATWQGCPPHCAFCESPEHNVDACLRIPGRRGGAPANNKRPKPDGNYAKPPVFARKPDQLEKENKSRSQSRSRRGRSRHRAKMRKTTLGNFVTPMQKGKGRATEEVQPQPAAIPSRQTTFTFLAHERQRSPTSTSPLDSAPTVTRNSFAALQDDTSMENQNSSLGPSTMEEDGVGTSSQQQA